MRGYLRVPLALLCVTGCDANQAPPVPVPTAPRDSVETIPDGPVQGKLRGQPFRAEAARYTVFRQRDREHIDVRLHTQAGSDPCARPDAGNSVWIRFEGTATLPKAGTYRSSDAWSLHYQVREEDGWHGVGKSAALLAIRYDAGTMVGDLAGCFADAQQSCVEGHFVARPCPDPLHHGVRDLQGEP